MASSFDNPVLSGLREVWGQEAPGHLLDGFALDITRGEWDFVTTVSDRQVALEVVTRLQGLVE